MRLKPALLGLLASGVALLVLPRGARADNIVLKNGQRLNVTGYQLVGDKYHVQMAGGSVDIPLDEVAAIEPEDNFAPPPPPPPTSTKPNYRDLVENSAAQYHVDADLISSVIATESNFNARAVSRKNARGLMQLMPETAARLGVHDVFDPRENIDAGTRYLGNLLQRYRNDLALALAAYNAGPERVEHYGRVPPFSETVSYVRKVQRTYQNSKSAAASKTNGAQATDTWLLNSGAPSAAPAEENSSGNSLPATSQAPSAQQP
jgi:soluble lytic murein transglycosylase-like protein